jgi:hypothetical protein
MALTLTPIGTSGKTRTPADEIDPDTILAVEEAYAWCQANPGRLEVDLKTREAAETFLHEARSYAYQRPEGRVVVAGNPTAAGLARFRVETYVKPASDTQTAPAPADS